MSIPQEYNFLNREYGSGPTFSPWIVDKGS
jgi:hypothetical protein